MRQEIKTPIGYSNTKSIALKLFWLVSYALAAIAAAAICVWVYIFLQSALSGYNG